MHSNFLYISQRFRSGLIMKKLFFIVLVLVIEAFVGTVGAQRLRGLHISSKDDPIIVSIDNQEISSPTMSCFIANLNQGHYRVKVFRTSFTGGVGACVYNKRVYYDGWTTLHIEVNTDEYPADDGYWRRQRDGGMSSEEFDLFYENYKSKSFDSEKKELLNYVLSFTGLYSKQALRLVKDCTFESDKKKLIDQLLPYIIDRENFYQVVEELSFLSDREEVYEKLKRQREY